MFRYQLACAFLFAAVLSAPVLAQDSGLLGDYTVTTWTDKEGLPAGRIRAIEQDADGYLWLGTDIGLVRFDGVRFVMWEASEGLGLPLSQVTALLRSRNGSLWVGLAETGLARIRERTLTTYTEKDGIGRAFVFSLTEDRSGTVWAGTLMGLYRFRGERWERVGAADGVGEGSVLAVYEDRLRRVWIATPAAVLRRDNEGVPFEQVAAIDVSNTSQHFSEDSDDTMWITDFQQGFRKVVPALSPVRSASHRGWGAHLLHDRRGNLWVATLGQGLWRVRAAATGSTAVETITVRDGLPSDAVQTLIEDREGNIWMGTRAGLQRLSPRRVRRVTDLPIPRALETTPDGSVWVGSVAGLTRFSAAGRQQYGEREGLPGSVVLALHTDERGLLWIATERGLAHFSNGRFSALVVPRGSQIERIFAITSSQGSVWFRDFYQGLFRLHDGAVTAADEIPEAERQKTQFVYADRAGNIWIGLLQGMLGVKRPNGRYESFSLGIGTVRSIYEDSTATLWVGGELGLSRLSGNRFTTVDRQNGFAGEVKSITEDAQGCLWLGLDSGIARLERQEFDRAGADREHQVQYRLFSTTDGVAGLPALLGSRSAVRDQSGRLWFITSAGITIMDPDNLGEPPLPPPVRIESVTTDAHSQAPAQNVTFPPRTSHLQVVFTALTLTDPMRVRFRYRLDGFDEHWIDAGANRQATYTNLPPRAYRFRVVASNNDGIWNEPGATWDFAIRPTFYQTRWFYVAGVATLALMVWGGWWLRVRRVRQQFALVLAERIRMSRAIHDSLLQGLVAIALQFDDLSHSLDASSAPIKGHVVRIRKNIEEYIREARHSIWELRSPVLETHDLAGALRHAAERAVAERAIQLDFVVQGVPRLFPREAEEQLLHIGQEVLHNAVRHAQPSRLGVELSYEDNQLRLRIRDDGCGFDLAAVRGVGGHFGLVSMQERAQQAGGTLTIETGPGQGTEIEATVPAA